MRPANHALIVIDVQNDFCPGGALAVADGAAIIPRINALMAEFPVRVLTQDWHPADHSSFAANHPGAAPFSLVKAGSNENPSASKKSTERSRSFTGRVT